jgi:uncharacterized protein (DUF486 family)
MLSEMLLLPLLNSALNFVWYRQLKKENKCTRIIILCIILLLGDLS